MPKRKVPFYRSPSRRYHEEVAERQRLTASHAKTQERRAERRARIRVDRQRTATQTALRVIRGILKHPSPAALDRLAGYCRSPHHDGEVRAAAARAILFLAHGREPRIRDDGEGNGNASGGV